MMNPSTTAAASPIISEEVTRLLTGLEAVGMFACVLLYIWRWQYTLPHLWIMLLAVVFATHFIHGDTLRDLGLTGLELRASAERALPIMLALYVPLVIYGFAVARLKLTSPGVASLAYFGGYGSWCVAQQYLMQSYFHNRLIAALRNPHLSSAMAALMFGAAHIPNPILMVATTVAGFVFAEVFAHHRNIWPLAFAQTVGGFLVAAVSPPSLIHNMRVGPGYLFWNLR
jgi:hypothetical protein